MNDRRAQRCTAAGACFCFSFKDFAGFNKSFLALARFRIRNLAIKHTRPPQSHPPKLHTTYPKCGHGIKNLLKTCRLQERKPTNAPHLHHSKPHVFGDAVRRVLQHPEDHVGVPGEIRGVPLRQNGDAQDQLFLQFPAAGPGPCGGGRRRRRENVEELVADLFPICGRAQCVGQG